MTICLAQGDSCRGIEIGNEEVFKLPSKIGESRPFVSPRTFSVSGTLFSPLIG